MGIDRIASPVDVAVSGLKAESLRMNVVANNIANSNTTKTDAGGPYRRQTVTLSADPSAIGGVKIQAVRADTTTELKKVLDPEDPSADKDGYVLMPNVDLPQEMMNLVMASRAYQANAAVLKKYQEMVDVALEGLR
jgi:flagellar basal-body rod protein FlgC